MTKPKRSNDEAVKNRDLSTQSKPTERRLQTSEEKYQTLFSSMREAFALHEVICDEAGVPVDYRFLEVNAGFEEQTGLKRDDVVGKTLLEVLPDSEPYWVERFGRVALTGESARFTDYSSALDKWYEVYVFCPARGQFAVLFTDITERKKAEETILRAKEEWERTFNTVPDMIAVLDCEHRIVRVNRAMANRLGVSPEQAEGLRCFEAVHGGAVPPVFCPHTLTCQDGKEHSAEVHEESLDGDFLVTTTPMLDSAGKVVGSIHVARDITERKRTEETLQDTQEDLKRAQAVAHVGSWRMNVQRNVLEWSEENHRIFGVPEGTSMTYETFLGSVHPDDREYVDRKWAAALQGEHYDIDHRIIVGDTVKWVRERAELEFDKDGGLIGGFGTTQDITERKQAAEILERQVLLLQRALAPARPSIAEGYSAASAYIPAFAGQEIGGDFYDIFRTEEDKVGILIGDVSGKGIEAAALASEARNTIRAFAYESSSPSMALGHANSLLARHGSTQFATVFLVVLDPVTGEMTYSGGGHPPALVCRGGGGIVELASRDIPIGLFYDLEYREDSTILEPGDRLVLYTDGVSEARNGGDLFGHEGILRTLLEYCDDEPETMVNRLVDTAREWANGRLLDDTAIVLVARD